MVNWEVDLGLTLKLVSLIKQGNWERDAQVHLETRTVYFHSFTTVFCGT